MEVVAGVLMVLVRGRYWWVGMLRILRRSFVVRLKRAAMRLMGDVVRSLRTTMDAELGGGSGWAAATRLLRAGGGACATRVVSLDDETFVRDRAAWPTGSVCGA